MAKGKTIATLVRNELGLLSLRGKKTWSETGRGGMIAQTPAELLGKCDAFLEKLGFVLVRRSEHFELWHYKDTGVHLQVMGGVHARIMGCDNGSAVEISYLLSCREWHEEQGIA